ncbi:MAG: dTDP-4-dehydrorhamnose reductase [bacterium]|nr:dTDP-4-dehydrorhamnose reductase [bacterium]
MKVLVLGANGMLGHALMDVLGPRWEVEGADRGEIDIRDAAAAARFIAGRRPDAVVNAAARTDVDGCEGDPAGAHAVNAEGAGNVARACAGAGARLVHLSTDYVFDGLKGSPYLEGDAPNPASVYGRSKLAGEVAVRERQPDHLIVRTSWLFGEHGRNFVDRILDAAAGRETIGVVGDQHGRPTYAPDLAAAIGRLIPAAYRGVVHVANDGVTSWYDYARAILELAGVRGVRVEEIGSGRLDRPAPRPPYSALDCTLYARLTGGHLRHWREAVRDHLARRTGRVNR